MTTKSEIDALRLMMKGLISESTPEEQAEFSRCRDALCTVLDAYSDELGRTALLFVMTERYSNSVAG